MDGWMQNSYKDQKWNFLYFIKMKYCPSEMGNELITVGIQGGELDHYVFLPKLTSLCN